MSETYGKATAETEKAVQLFAQWVIHGKPYLVVSELWTETPSELLIVGPIRMPDGSKEFRTARFTPNSDT